MNRVHAEPAAGRSDLLFEQLPLALAGQAAALAVLMLLWPELAAQPLGSAERAIDVAGAHWFEQSRRDAFRGMAGKDALSVDVEPAQLAVALVNRYHAVKRSGLL